MPSDRASQTIGRRRLAAELRRLREHAGLTGDEAAERLGWSGSKISRIETHRIGVKPADLSKLLDLYGVEASRREEISAFAREPSRAGGLDSAIAGLPADVADYFYAEEEAQLIWNWDPLIIPGLLQTEEYARAIMSGIQAMFRLPPGDAERRIRLRRTRQELLTRDPPLQLSVVIDESVLHRKFGGNAVMRPQLVRLAETSELPNVEVRVLRLDGKHLIGTGAFSYMRFAQVHDVPLPDIVAVEHLTGNYYLEDEEQTFRYRVTFEALMARAADAQTSRELISEAARARWS
jgi:transcriptional regulator with XRE-family HTH domain